MCEPAFTANFIALNHIIYFLFDFPASESAIAIACLRLFTFFLLFPIGNLPFLYSLITFAIFFSAFFITFHPYFLIRVVKLFLLTMYQLLNVLNLRFVLVFLLDSSDSSYISSYQG